MQAKKRSDGVIEFSDSGLKLEINPVSMFRDTLHGDIRPILDKMIESELKEALEAFRDSEENQIEYRKLLYQKEKFSKLIYKIAIIDRELVLKLHSDSEDIDLGVELQEIYSYAHSVWRFDSSYAYTSSVELKQEIK